VVTSFKATTIGGQSEKDIKYVVKDKTLELLDTRVLSQTIGPNFLHVFVNSKDNSSYQCSKLCSFFGREDVCITS
jgi:hypothetical protein